MGWKPFWHRPGMRNIKTAVAVVICFLLFLPFWSQASPAGEGMQIGPFYACITAVICMQSSVEQSVRQGVSRVIGTLMGGALGLLVLVLYDVTGQHALVMALLLLPAGPGGGDPGGHRGGRGGQPPAARPAGE